MVLDKYQLIVDDNIVWIRPAMNSLFYFYMTRYSHMFDFSIDVIDFGERIPPWISNRIVDNSMSTLSDAFPLLDTNGKRGDLSRLSRTSNVDADQQTTTTKQI